MVRQKKNTIKITSKIMEIPYIIVEWIWKKTPVLNEFSDDTKAIISYSVFCCAVICCTILGSLYYGERLYLP